LALSFKDPETESLAREVAGLTGETLTEAVRTSLRDRLRREQLKRGGASALAGALRDIAGRCAALPSLDDRTDDEILGYGADGLPS
jgi:antitoxin VapB